MATELELRQHRCCFTGHRPNDLKRPAWLIKIDLEREIKKAVNEGFTVFISGMAQGVDIWAAQIVLKLRQKGAPIKLICACPFAGFESRWDPSWQQQYKEILDSADLVRYICPSYSRSCFQIRNEWMVDHSARVIAVFNNVPGGTFNTIEYTNSHLVPVVYIRG